MLAVLTLLNLTIMYMVSLKGFGNLLLTRKPYRKSKQNENKTTDNGDYTIKRDKRKSCNKIGVAI